MVPIELTARQQYILKAVYDAGTLETQSLLPRLRVSRRTIQRDIHALQEYLTVYGVALNLSSSGLLQLSGSDIQVETAMSAVHGLQQVLAFHVRDREFYIVSELLWANEPVKITYLSHRLKVAEASISGDLDRLSHWFTDHRLRLVRRRGYGVEVLGEEDAKRGALAELLHDHVPMHELMSAWSRNEDALLDEGHSKSFATGFPRHELERSNRS